MAAKKKTRSAKKPARRTSAGKKTRAKPKTVGKTARTRGARSEPEQPDSVRAIARSFALRHLR